MRPFACLALPLLAACSQGERVTRMTIGDAEYRIPKAHVRSASRQPHQFVRIKHPDFSFELVHDSRIARRNDRAGWPMVFSVNEQTAPDIDRHLHGDLKVVCRRAVDPKAGCGLRISHRGENWDVLFPNAQRIAAPVIRERARATLAAYQS